VVDRVPGLAERASHLRQHMEDERLRHRAYTREHGQDPPELSDWSWPSHGAARPPQASPAEPRPVGPGGA
jgi:xylulose-5-phosphate/fructose-6-phosphate phosphoketolase